MDTHVWLWWNDEPERLSERARYAISAADAIGVSAMSCWEIGLLVEKGRIRLEGGSSKWVRAALSGLGVVSLPVSPKIALDAAQLDRSTFPGDPADRLIYSTARSEGASLITRDERIRTFDPRGTIW